jgi:hypothetical protein
MVYPPDLAPRSILPYNYHIHTMRVTKKIDSSTRAANITWILGLLLCLVTRAPLEHRTFIQSVTKCPRDQFNFREKNQDSGSSNTQNLLSKIWICFAALVAWGQELAGAGAVEAPLGARGGRVLVVDAAGAVRQRPFWAGRLERPAAVMGARRSSQMGQNVLDGDLGGIFAMFFSMVILFSGSFYNGFEGWFFRVPLWIA